MMMGSRIPREWLLALLLGGGVVVWLGSLFVLPAPKEDIGTEAVADPPRFTVHEGRWMRTDEGGAPVYRVSAERIHVYADERMSIEAPRVDGLGQHSEWQLVAPRGRVPPGGGELQLIDGVDVKGNWADDNPLTAVTDHLTVDTVSRTLHTDAEVVINSAGRSARGTGLRADWDGERIELLGQVRMQMDAPPR